MSKSALERFVSESVPIELCVLQDEINQQSSSVMCRNSLLLFQNSPYFVIPTPTVDVCDSDSSLVVHPATLQSDVWITVLMISGF